MKKKIAKRYLEEVEGETLLSLECVSRNPGDKWR